MGNWMLTPVLVAASLSVSARAEDHATQSMVFRRVYSSERHFKATDRSNGLLPPAPEAPPARDLHPCRYSPPSSSSRRAGRPYSDFYRPRYAYPPSYWTYRPLYGGYRPYSDFYRPWYTYPPSYWTYRPFYYDNYRPYSYSTPGPPEGRRRRDRTRCGNRQ